MAKEKYSCGLLMYKRDPDRGLQVFLVHPTKVKREMWWDIPKGGRKKGEDDFICAQREFIEETGIIPNTDAEFIDLGEAKGRTKTYHIWAFEGDGKFKGSNTFTAEYPKGSGKYKNFPEIDDGRFFTIKKARKILYDKLRVYLGRLERLAVETDPGNVPPL